MKRVNVLVGLAFLAGMILPLSAQQGQWQGQGQWDRGRWDGQDPRGNASKWGMGAGQDFDWRTTGGRRIIGFNPSIISKAMIHLPEAKEAVEHLQKAESLEKEGHWTQAVNIYQNLMSEFPDQVVAKSEGIHLGIKEHCERLLRSEPPDRLKAYRENFDHVAKRHLATALKDSNFTLLYEIAEKFSLTSAGEDALALAGDLAYEDGRFEEAFYYWGRLIRLYPDSKKLAGLVPKCILAAHRAPDNTHLLNTLAGWASTNGHAKQEVTVNQKKHTLENYVKEAMAALPKSATADYRSLKDYFYPKPYEIALEANLWRWKAPNSGLLPAVEGNFLAVHYNESLWIMNVQSGGLLRHHKETVVGGVEVTRNLLQNVTLNKSQAFTPLWSFTTRPGGSFSVMDKPIQNVFAYGIENGGVMWDQKGVQLNVKSAPEVTEQHAYTVMEFMEKPDSPPEYRVVCTDRNTGKMKWATYICVNTTGFNTLGTPSIDPFAQAAAVYGDTLYVSTNAGLVAALESRTGAIQWMHSYQVSDPKTPTWNLTITPPLLDRGRLLVSPHDTPSVFCLDAATGELKWKHEMKARGQCEGIVDGRAVISSSQGVAFIDMATGKQVGEWSHPSSGKDVTPVGKGALSKKYLYLPTMEGVWYIQIEDPSKSGMTSWPDPSQDPGTLLLLPGGTLTVSVSKSVNMYVSSARYEQIKQKQPPTPPNKK